MDRENKKTALVVEGGAMRGIYSAGVLDALLEKGSDPFDLYLGVSAGATNLAAYLAGMQGRNYRVYTEYSLDPAFISAKKFIRGEHLMDLDWLWYVTIRDLRLDLDRLSEKRDRFFIGLTDARTGEATYLTPASDQLEHVLKASSAIPVFYKRTLHVDGIPYVDGGVADPIPVKKAHELGADRIVVLRSRPEDYRMKDKRFSPFYRWFFKDHPAVAEATLDRARVYNEAIAFIEEPPAGVEVIALHPPQELGLKRFTKEIDVLDAAYEEGFRAGEALMRRLEEG